PMGEAGNGSLKLTFDSRLKLEFHGAPCPYVRQLLAGRRARASSASVDIVAITGGSIRTPWHSDRRCVVTARNGLPVSGSRGLFTFAGTSD
ncbi:MAG: hypothetical protein QGI33_08280, partial [Candidatus Brocadiia bacterium]|nr:hypothetical protein [Candidatus Brocadiia bacterium]